MMHGRKNIKFKLALVCANSEF